jgi:hypothetical protein
MSVLSAGAPSATLECVEEALVAVSSLHETLQKMYIPSTLLSSRLVEHGP